MKNAIKKFLSVIISIVIVFSLNLSILTVAATTKNTVTTSITKTESKAKGFKVTWKKKSKIKGYQIQYSTSSKFKKSSSKTKTITKAKTNSATISKLKGCNAVYYVRIRTYKVSNGKKIYSSWSKSNKVTTLKHKYSKATCTKAKTCKYCDKTSGKKLGHSYSSGVCSRCGVKDKNYVKTYSIGETWVVNDEFKITVNSVKTHYACDSWLKSQSESKNIKQIITIDYTYENIGYIQTNDNYDLQLYVSSGEMKVYDETGEIGLVTGACSHGKQARSCEIGTRCNAVYNCMLYNESSKATIYFNLKTTDGTVVKAKFLAPVS